MQCVYTDKLNLTYLISLHLLPNFPSPIDKNASKKPAIDATTEPG